MKTALTIAGSDSSGGAGIQADIKTMMANGVYAMSAVTALTAQNTTGVTDILESTPYFLGEQLDAVFTDIFPDAVKIGMVSSAELITVIAEKLKQYGAKHIVVDPVMVATSGAKLLRPDAMEALARLLPMAEVLTPNIPEAEILSGLSRPPQRASVSGTAAPYCARAAIRSMTPMICCGVMVWGNGFGASASIIPIPMVPAAPSPAPLPPIWPRAMDWMRPWSGPRRTSPGRWRLCWTWGTAPAP